MSQKIGIALVLIVSVVWTGFGWWRNTPKEGRCTSCGPVLTILDLSPNPTTRFDPADEPEQLTVMPREVD